MTSPTLNVASAGSPEPMPPLADVRAELAAVTNVDAFDRWLELAIARAEREGDFARFRKELHGWVRTAVIGVHQDELLAAASREERNALIDQLTAAWLATHPAHTSFAA